MLHAQPDWFTTTPIVPSKIVAASNFCREVQQCTNVWADVPGKDLIVMKVFIA